MPPAGSAAWSAQCRWQCRHGAGSCRGRSSATAQPAHDAPGSELSVNDILQRTVHQRQVSVHAFEPSVLILQFTQLRQVRHRHARVLAFPFVVSRLAHAVFPARFTDLGAQLDLLEDGNDLAFTESRFLHVETPLVGILYSHVDQVFEGASQLHQLQLLHIARQRQMPTRTTCCNCSACSCCSCKKPSAAMPSTPPSERRFALVAAYSTSPLTISPVCRSQQWLRQRLP